MRDSGYGAVPADRSCWRRVTRMSGSTRSFSTSEQLPAHTSRPFGTSPDHMQSRVASAT